MVKFMDFSKLEILSVLEILAILANGISILTGLILSLTVLVKSILAKRNNMRINSEDFSAHEKLFLLLKSCGRCAFIFQFLAWLMFSSKQTGFIQLPVLTYSFALSWAVLCIINFTFGIISRFFNGKETNNVMIGRKTTWMMFYSILYFVVTFLIF